MDTFEEVYNLPSVFGKYLTGNQNDIESRCWDLREGIYYQTSLYPEGGYVVMPEGIYYVEKPSAEDSFEISFRKGKRLIYEDATDEYVRNVTLVDI